MKTSELAGRPVEVGVTEDPALSPSAFSQRSLRAGDLCPQCSSASLDYNGLLQLACPACGYALEGCFT